MRGGVWLRASFFEYVAANGEQMVVAGRNQGQVKKKGADSCAEGDSGCMKGKS